MQDMWNGVNALKKESLQWSGSSDWVQKNIFYVNKFITGKRQRILEYGFGKGELLQDLSDKGHFVSGAEISDVAISNLKKLYPEIEFYNVAHPNGIKNREFDAITCTGILHHIAPKEWDSYLKGFSELLRKKGKLIITGCDKTDAKFAGKATTPAIQTDTNSFCLNYPTQNIADLMKKNNLFIKETELFNCKAPDYEQPRTFRYYFIEKQ
jgi:cyclopropane fatty-acyl-phospholipid synthase-like methyltransferase